MYHPWRPGSSRCCLPMLNNKNSAALYCRSSKDRHEISIDAQIRELRELAKQKQLSVTAEFTDPVERADDWERPGFRQLLAAIANPARGWSTLLVLDTSRIARDDDLLRATFAQECRRRSVKILYAKIPSVNPMFDVAVQGVFQIMDKMHSMMSREKGLAGMAENVRQGFRAGGRAPLGYQLERVKTGAMRDGAPVTKSRLVISPDAEAVTQYLRGRAAGRSPAGLVAECGLEKLNNSTLVGMEWNALTYAGHTVWNMTNTRKSHGYEGGTKRRPRSEWVIQRDTHQALITEGEAERILQRLEGKRQTRMRGAEYLLSGLLETPSGARWHGNAGYYRTGKKNISAKNLEAAIMGKIVADMTSEDLVKALLSAAQTAAKPARLEAENAALQKRIAAITQRAARVANLVPEMKHPEALLAKLDELQVEKTKLERQAAEKVDQLGAIRAVSSVTESDVRSLLRSLTSDLQKHDPAQVKDFLRGSIEKITLDPAGTTCCLHYAIPVFTGDSVASPRAADVIPTMRLRRFLRLAA